MNRKEALRQFEQENRLMSIGISRQDAESLRRISMQLGRWGESLCNDTEEDEDGKAYRYCGPMMETRYRVPNRGAGALKRLEGIMKAYPHLWAYHQPDPRGAALYIGRWESLGGGPMCNRYTSGLAVW